MKRILGIFAVVMAIVGLSTTAQAQLEVTHTRTITGLDVDGFLIPGTAQLQITLNVDSAIIGPDFDVGSAVNILTSLGFTETAPTGWSYAGLVAGDNNPDIKPANNAVGDFGFAWITTPATPFSFTYKVNLPVDETGPVSFTGISDYRTNGGSIFGSAGATLVQVKPTTVALDRTLSGAGITGPLGQFYVPGQNIDVTVTLTKDGDAEVTALGTEDIIPTAWTYAGLVAGDNNPDIKPANGATGTLGFGWITPPVFPFSFTYRVAVPANEAEVDRTLTAVAKYRLGGGEILSNTDVEVLDGAPCTTLTLAGEGGNFYASSTIKNIVVNVDATCTTAIQALGVNTTTPAGWSYAGLVAGDNNPDIKPANAATGDFGFAWISPPATPFTFTYRVNVPANEVGDKAIDGEVEYRLGAGALFSEPFNLVLSGADLVPPVITLNGNADESVECSGSYSDAGATASDDRDGDISGSIVTAGDTVDTTTPGVYVITYDVSDIAGNAATQVTRTVTVSDTTVPTITLNGSSSVPVECGAGFTDAGATASDTCDTAVSVVVGGDVVDSTNPGVYVITYNATDASNKAAAEVTRTVTVSDTVAPVITLNGAATENVQCGGVYNDAGATAFDSCEGSLGNVTGDTSGINTAVPGNYVVTYNVTDTSGNAATQVTRSVNVVDTTAPVVTINSGVDTVECGGSFNDAGATASDICDAAVSVVVGGDVVDTTSPGVYVITYNATDASGNAATQVTRSVNVVDTTAPVITLNGAASVTVQCGASYADAGAVASDTCDNSVTVSNDAANAVDTSNPGTYTVTFSASDDSGNAATTVTREVIVEDTTAPVITLLGSANVTVECGANFTDDGATAIDACDGNITGSILINSDFVGTVPGNYTVTYDVQDSSANAGVQVVRSITVSDTAAPTLIVNGGNETVECGGAYTDAGAQASDTCDGDLTASIVVGGDVVNTANVGTYFISYAVADAAGNSASGSRTVTVADTTDPILTLNGDATVNINCGDSYADAGATASDTCDAAVDVNVDATAVNPTAAGSYTVTITATDSTGNSVTATRTVNVIDAVLPVVTLNGDAAIQQNCTDTYAEAGASANDACEGDLAVVTSGQVVNGTPGSYTITYTATDSSGNIGTATRTVTIADNCVGPNECADDDINGIADDIFSCLDTDGESLTLNVNGGTCIRRVYAVTWFGDVAGSDVAAVVENPNDANQNVSVSVPRGVIGAGQQGILVVSVACSLEDLLGDEAFNLATTPDGEVAGNAWFDVTIIVSDDGGNTFSKLDNSVLAGTPVTITINGLNATAGSDAALQSHSTTIEPGVSGAQILALVDTWSEDGVESAYADGSIVAEATELSVFGAFESIAPAAVLTVSPNPASDFIVGITRPQESVNNTIKVKNTGGGSLSGVGTINDPNGVFTLVGDASYVLGSGAEDTLTVRFAPAGKLGNFTATLTLTNSAGAPVTVTLKATSAVIIKNIQILGCGPEGTTGQPGADLAVVALALGALVLSSRAYRRAKQS